MRNDGLKWEKMREGNGRKWGEEMKQLAVFGNGRPLQNMGYIPRCPIRVFCDIEKQANSSIC